MAEIIRELPKPPNKQPQLDDSLFKPTQTELDFLKIAVDQDENRLKEKLLTVQRRAYAEYPYPCIRAFHFVSLLMSQNPAYSEILKTAEGLFDSDTSAPIFLDLGCCMGSDVRKLALDGYPASSIIGCDIRPQYITLGHELFGDSSETCLIRFITGDIFELPLEEEKKEEKEPKGLILSEVTNLSQLKSRVKYLYVGALFHLFDEKTQLAIARRVARLVSRESGVIIFGRHQGLENAGRILNDSLGRDRFGHSPGSWTNMWQTVFSETDGEKYVQERVIVKAVLSEPGVLGGLESTHRMLTWSIHLV